MSLRPGARRSQVLEYSVIDFVYNKRLRLRGLQRTCQVAANCSPRAQEPKESQLRPPVRQLRLLSNYEYFLRPTLGMSIHKP